MLKIYVSLEKLRKELINQDDDLSEGLEYLLANSIYRRSGMRLKVNLSRETIIQAIKDNLSTIEDPSARRHLEQKFKIGEPKPAEVAA